MSWGASPGRLRALGALVSSSGHDAALFVVELVRSRLDCCAYAKDFVLNFVQGELLLFHVRLSETLGLFFKTLILLKAFLFFLTLILQARLLDASLGPLLELLRYFAIRHARPQRGTILFVGDAPKTRV